MCSNAIRGSGSHCVGSYSALPECQYTCTFHVPHLLSWLSFSGFCSARQHPQPPWAFLCSSQASATWSKGDVARGTEEAGHPVRYPTTTASSEETPCDFLASTARCPLLWLHSPAWRVRNVFAQSPSYSYPLKAESWALESLSCYQLSIFVCE